jgi:hypothetical protein
VATTSSNDPFPAEGVGESVVALTWCDIKSEVGAAMTWIMKDRIRTIAASSGEKVKGKLKREIIAGW